MLFLPMKVAAKMEFSCAIIIVNYNSWKLLARCLKSLSRQTLSGFKIFVADNSSKEAPPDDIFSSYPDLTFIQLDSNYGFAEANNRLIKKAKGFDWIITLNPDAFPEPKWLESLVASSLKNPEYSFFSSRLINDSNPEIIDGDGDIYHFSGLAWRGRYGMMVSTDKEPYEVFGPCAAAAMYKNNELHEVGCFDSDFFCYMEDVDLAFRLQLQGNRCLHVPGALVRHVGAATSGGQQSDFAVYYGHRNLIWTYFKNMPVIFLWLFLPGHIFLNFFSIIWFALRGQGKVILRAKLDGLKGLFRMISKRKRIKHGKNLSYRRLFRLFNKRFCPCDLKART